MTDRNSDWNWLGLGAVASALLAGSTGALWMTRRRFLQQLLNLPPATHEITIERNIVIRTADGEALVHDHFRPKSATPLPTILIRTPYGRGRTSPAGFFKQIFGNLYAERGYNVILQDVRGRFESSGEFEPYFHEVDDGKITVDWIVKMPWSDGQIGMMGQSYLGFTQWAAAAKDTDQRIKALFPIITQSRLGGLPDHAYPLDLAMRWLLILDAQADPDLSFWERMRRFGDLKRQNEMLEAGFHTLPLSDSAQAVFGRDDRIFDNWVSHSEYSDPYWHLIDQRHNVKDAPPAHFVGGWHDLFIAGQIDDYQAQRANGRNPYLTVGPWVHMDARSQSTTFADSLRWFDKYLKGNDAVRPNPVRVHVMGANEWRDFPVWPPAATEKTLYLQGNGSAGGTLHPYIPRSNSRPSQYRYDPSDPTPNVGGALLGADAGSLENQELEARDDVLTFTTPILEQDTDVIGHPKVVLFVQTSAETTDFFGRICDVHPNGKSYNICDELYRIKPERNRLTPEGGYRLEIKIAPTAHRFKQGHRIRLQISSGAFPRFNRNLGLGENFLFAKEMVVAEQTVCHDAAHPSQLILPIVPAC